VRAAAAYVGLSVKSIRRMIEDGTLTVYRPRPGRVLVDFAELAKVVRLSAGWPGKGVPRAN
jgi:excisionase family DNA binding protein